MIYDTRLHSASSATAKDKKQSLVYVRPHIPTFPFFYFLSPCKSVAAPTPHLDKVILSAASAASYSSYSFSSIYLVGLPRVLKKQRLPFRAVCQLQLVLSSSHYNHQRWGKERALLNEHLAGTPQSSIKYCRHYCELMLLVLPSCIKTPRPVPFSGPLPSPLFLPCLEVWAHFTRSHYRSEVASKLFLLTRD